MLKEEVKMVGGEVQEVFKEALDFYYKFHSVLGQVKKMVIIDKKIDKKSKLNLPVIEESY